MINNKIFTFKLFLIEKTFVKKAKARLSGPPETATAKLSFNFKIFFKFFK